MPMSWSRPELENAQTLCHRCYYPLNCTDVAQRPMRSAPLVEAGGETATPLVLQLADGEHRMRRPPPASLSTLAAPFIIKVDERNGGAKDFVLFTEDVPPGQTISPHRHPHSEEILFIHAELARRGSTVKRPGSDLARSSSCQ